MIQKPLVSVIIPTFNRAQYIGETLNCILAQTYDQWECIVVDDGSTDHTDQLMDSFLTQDARFKFYKRPKERTKGANACRNYGFEMSVGQYIQWFDSDDLLVDTKLEDQIADLMASDKKISLCNYMMFQGSLENQDPVDARLKKDGHSTFLSYIAGQSLLNMQIALFDRTIVESVQFDEQLHQSQDLDFVYRLLKNNYDEVSITDKVLCYIRKHSDSITMRFRRGHLDELSSDIAVRERIFTEMYSELPEGDIKSGLLHRTLYSYRSLLVHDYTNEYLKKMQFISNRLSFKRKAKLIGLIGLGFVYKMTNKGLYTYGKFLKTI